MSADGGANDVRASERLNYNSYYFITSKKYDQDEFYTDPLLTYLQHDQLSCDW